MGEGGGGEEKFGKKRNRNNTSTGARPDREVRFILGELFDM